MKNKSKIFNVFVIALTLCLAAVLAFVIADKLKTKNENTEKPDDSSFSLNISDLKAVGTTAQDVEEEPELLPDASWEDMVFVLSGVEYKLPLDVSELKAHGWKGFPEKEVEPGEEVYFEVNNGTAAVKGYLCNPADSKMSVSECKVTKINFTWANAVFPRNIEIMKSTLDDVIEKYGKPLYEDEDAGKIIYEKIDYEGGFEALIDENKPGIEFFYDDNGLIVYAGLYCGKIDKEAE